MQLQCFYSVMLSPSYICHSCSFYLNVLPNFISLCVMIKILLLFCCLCVLLLVLPMHGPCEGDEHVTIVVVNTSRVTRTTTERTRTITSVAPRVKTRSYPRAFDIIIDRASSDERARLPASIIGNCFALLMVMGK